MVRIGLIAITVIDMEESRNFYEDVLGFKVINTNYLPSFLQLTDENQEITILLQAFGSLTAPKPADSYPQSPGTALNLSVDNIQEEYIRLHGKVPVLTDRIQDSPGGPYFTIADPSGNFIELIQFT